MTTELLERPPAEETSDEKAGDAAPPKHGDEGSEEGRGRLEEESDEGPGRYAPKLHRARTATKAAQEARLRAERRRGRRKRGGGNRVLAIALRVGLPGAVLLAAAWMLGGRSLPEVPLPPVIEPAHFHGIIELRSTERVGTMFHAMLQESPSPSSADEFRGRVDHVVSVLRDAGYESILILAPDGATVVSGSLDGVIIGPLGVRGT